jgi:SAM-dependent methyltransferase
MVTPRGMKMPKGRWGTTEDVRAFWEDESCGERYSKAEAVDYCRIDSERYHREPQIEAFAQFNEPFAGTALEIGLGTGSDFQRNRQRGGRWIGAELTSRSLSHVTRRFGTPDGLVQADAQRLPFRDDSFDLVYSWGVLLCCPNFSGAVDEVWRVLKPGATAKLMLYHARSWVAIAAWLRWGWWRGLSPQAAITYLESPGTRAFRIGEAYRLLNRFSEVSVSPIHTYWDEKWFGPLGKLGGDRMGWFLLCELRR